MHIDIIFPQILILALLAIVGVAGSKAGVISPEGKDILAKIVFNITLPFMLLTNFSKIEVSPRLLTNSLSVLGLTCFVLFFMLFAGWLMTRLLKMKQSEAVIYKAHSALGNLVYLGFPLIFALYGEEGLLYASIYQIVSNLFTWTVGVIILNQGKGSSLRHNLKHVFNLNTLAVSVGFTLFLFSIKLPLFLLEPMSGLGACTSYLAMLYIGAILFYSKKEGLFTNYIVYILSASKLLLVPIVIMLIFKAVSILALLKFDSLVVSVLILQAAMPCMVNVVIMAKIFGADDEFATTNVFVSTLLSIITLPLILLLLGYMM